MSNRTPLPICWMVFLLYLAPVVAESPRGVVVSYNPLAASAGERILQEGGNAFDAFIATTFAEYVVTPGGTSLAGTLGALIFHAPSRTVEYLDGDYNRVRHPSGSWSTSDGFVNLVLDRSGKAVLVPGAVAGLELLSKKYGRVEFARVLAPAIDLAQNGFKVDEFYAAVVSIRADVLRKSPYGKRTFFVSDQPIRKGDTLKQPEVAEFLRNVVRSGAPYMYTGPWAA